MKYSFIEQGTKAELDFYLEEPTIVQNYINTRGKSKFFTLALNLNVDQNVLIDGDMHAFPSNSILPLFANQTFLFNCPEKILAWQYNSEFYEGISRERDMNNGGLLFFGKLENIVILIDPINGKKIENIRKLFLEEFLSANPVQKEMLDILLRQLVVIITRMAREQYFNGKHAVEERSELIKRYHRMVETYFKEQHGVQFYAEKLNRSPKTLSNLFLMYNHKSPVLVIHDRIIKEAKRLFYYTDKSAKEIAYELGFEEQAHFSRFFKNRTNQSPSDYKRNYSGFC
jgi:AraC family transcriptional activator of pobA